MKSREQIIQEIKSINTKYLNQDTMNGEPIEVLSDKTINELADIGMEREKDKEQKQIKPQKLSKKVINIDCPYKGKHKYELSKDELKEYEKIKKRLQRAKLLSTPELDILIADFKANLDFMRKENNNELHVSFSGGKDSTILLNIVRMLKQPGDKIYVNVYAENFYPEIAAFIQKTKKYGESKGEIGNIQSTGGNLWRIGKEYGGFGHSKFIMRVIANIQNILDNPKGKGYKYDKYKALEVYGDTLRKYGLEHIFNDLCEGNIRFKSNFSGKNSSCCNLVKNSQKKHDKGILTGMRAVEKNRSKIVCKDKDKKALNIMKNGTDENEQQAIKKYKIEISEIYKYEKRTGCIFCPFAGNKSFNFCGNRYYDKMTDENKKLLEDMKKAREYFKPRYEN